MPISHVLDSTLPAQPVNKRRRQQNLPHESQQIVGMPICIHHDILPTPHTKPLMNKKRRNNPPVKPEQGGQSAQVLHQVEVQQIVLAFLNRKKNPEN